MSAPGPLALVAAALVLGGCASRGPERATGQPAPPAPPMPPAAVSMPAPPAPVSVPAPPAPPPSPRPLTGAIDCPVKREWPVRLFADRPPFRAQWRECRARRALDLPQQQIALWQAGVSALAWGLENTNGESRLLIEKARTVDLDADGQKEILIVLRHEGTGGYIEWCLAGRKGDAIGCWDAPDLDGPAAKLLEPDEDFGAHGWQLRVLPRGLRLERSVAHKGVDPNCCPTRGSVVARLSAAGGRLRIAALSRRPGTPRSGPAARS